MPQWIFRHLRSNMREVDIGPYNSKKDAEEQRDEQASHGELVSPVMPIPNGYRLFNAEVEDKAAKPCLNN